MSVATFSKVPFRAIRVMPLDMELGLWTGCYSGDAYREPFQTEPGPLFLVMDAVKFADVRCGLPIIVEAAQSATAGGFAA